MALHVPRAPGFAQLLKDGAKHFSGLEEAVFRNIGACKEFADTVRTTYGPNGLNKIVINHIDKLFVTSDAATIMRELEVEHPAAKMVVLAAKMQEEEVGDGTNFVVILCGALLKCAEDLLRAGMKPVEVISGYKMALTKCLDFLPSLVCHTVTDCRDRESVAKAMKAAIMSKQFGYEDFLCKMISDACVSILPDKTTAFNVDNVRVCKILGSGLLSSEVVQGIVFKKQVEGDIIRKSQAKIAVFTCPIDIGTTETKGTVLIKTAEELRNFSEGEENLLEKQINAIKASGADVVVSGSKFGDMALHFINKAGMMAVKVLSKFDVRRLCRAVNATALPSLIEPTKEELGYADSVYLDELGDTSVVVFKLDGNESRISTIVVRGSTDNYMDDIERAVDDGVNTFKGLSKDGRMLPGAGAVEFELAKHLREAVPGMTGIEQYAILAFADALEELPKAIADNSGVDDPNIVQVLQKAHLDGSPHAGINIEAHEESKTVNAHEQGIWDLYLTKYWGLKYAVSATNMILRVDQIIMAKRAGGPAPPKPGAVDEDD